MAVSWSSKRLGVALTGVVGALSILTGVVNIAYGDVTVIGPLQPYVPDIVRTAAGFTGAITGFVVLLGAYALRRGFRVGWYMTIVLLPVTAAQGLIQSSPMSVPLVLCSLATIPLLVHARRGFDQPITLGASQIAAGLALTGVFAYGTVGAYALREQYDGIETLLDAFYFTIVTASTVGYGDVEATTQTARLFTITVLVFGTASFAVALGALLGPVIEARFASAVGRVRGQDLQALEDHVLVLGYGDLTEPVVDQLSARRPFVVVSRRGQETTDLSDRDVLAVQGDPSEESLLERVRIDRASAAIVATENDAKDAYSVLTARQSNPDLRIVAAATNSENASKLERAGADVVITPSTIGGTLLVGSVATDDGGDSIADGGDGGSDTIQGGSDAIDGGGSSASSN